MKKRFNSKDMRDQLDRDILTRLNEILDDDEVKKKQADLRGLLKTLGYEGNSNVKDFLDKEMKELGDLSKGAPDLLKCLSASRSARTDPLPFALRRR